eukprot:498220-Pyramimonas_sp.AAC.1
MLGHLCWPPLVAHVGRRCRAVELSAGLPAASERPPPCAHAWDNKFLSEDWEKFVAGARLGTPCVISEFNLSIASVLKA